MTVYNCNLPQVYTHLITAKISLQLQRVGLDQLCGMYYIHRMWASNQISMSQNVRIISENYKCSHLPVPSYCSLGRLCLCTNICACIYTFLEMWDKMNKCAIICAYVHKDMIWWSHSCSLYCMSCHSSKTTEWNGIYYCIYIAVIGLAVIMASVGYLLMQNLTITLSNLYFKSEAEILHWQSMLANSLYTERNDQQYTLSLSDGWPCYKVMLPIQCY